MKKIMLILLGVLGIVTVYGAQYELYTMVLICMVAIAFVLIRLAIIEQEHEKEKEEMRTRRLLKK